MSTWIRSHQKIVVMLLLIVFVLSLLPIFLISGYDCAAGDDYFYGADAHLKFLETGSVIQAIIAVFYMVANIWHIWQGTWFDVFVFGLHPEVFHEGAYVIVPYIFLTMQIAAYALFFHHFIKVRWKIDGMYWIMLTLVYLIFSFQLVPSQKSAFFWWVGCIHYCMPMCLSLTTIVLIDRFLEEHKISDFVLTTVCCTLLGGATYPAAMLVAIAGILLVVAKNVISKKHEKKDFWLLLPFALEMIGLIISMVAPGNAARSAYDLTKGAVPSGGAVETIFKSIAFSVSEAITLFLGEKSFVIIALIIVAIIAFAFFEEIPNREFYEKLFSHPVLFLITLFLLNASVYTPRLYAGGVVSSGYLNFNFWLFFLCTGASIIYICGWIKYRTRLSGVLGILPKAMIWCVILFSMLIIAYVGRHGIKGYTDYVCMEYYLTGQADDYKKQMELQRYLMKEEGIEEVVVPEINNEQGPLMHMPIVADPENVDNMMTRVFYGKNSCRSIPRPQWMKQYGEKYSTILKEIGLE